MAYNPFPKAIGSTLDETDLHILVSDGVAEGYTVEYKAQLPSTTKIAKSIASFANTFGGWYIVGVETDEHNVAKAVTGIDPTEQGDPTAVVRDAVRHRIDPVPTFHIQVVRLSSGRLVLVAYIPQEQTTPFITSDGRIYRRTHDSSEPIQETNRYAIDQLVSRGRESEQAFSRWAQDNRTFSKAEKHGWVKIFLSPTPLGAVQKLDVTEQATMSALIERSRAPVKFRFPVESIGISGNVVLNHGLTTPTSLILRSVLAGSEAFSSITIELDENGRCRIFIPTYFESAVEVAKGLESPDVCELMLQWSRGTGPEPKFFDLGQTWLAAANLVNFYFEWLGPQPVQSGFEYAIEVDETWRAVGVCDHKAWAAHVAAFGMPVLLVDTLRFPPKPGSSMTYDVSDVLWLDVCADIGLCYGLPRAAFNELFTSVMFNAARRSQGG